MNEWRQNQAYGGAQGDYGRKIGCISTDMNSFALLSVIYNLQI